MDSKHKKAQVVITAIDSKRQSFNVLLLQTNQKRGEFWQNCTGKMEVGESYEEGALREALEETAIKVEHIVDFLELGLSFEFIDQRNNDVIEKCFLMIIDEPVKIKIDPHEHQNYKWIHIEDITPNCVFYGSNYEALNKAQILLKHWGQ